MVTTEDKNVTHTLIKEIKQIKFAHKRRKNTSAIK